MAKPRVHVALALGLGLAQAARTGRVVPSLAPFVTGVLVDVDHFVDQALYLAARRETRRVILPLHGWEYVALLALVERGLLGRWTGGGLTLGYLAHLLTDQLTNPQPSPFGYFLAYRAWRGFPRVTYSHSGGRPSWLAVSPLKFWKHL